MRAFSLVELSIVLVILGLLTGGILSGQSLIRAAELRNATTEYQRYSSAMHSFHDRYMALPGDMPNATKFWGEAAAGAACATTIGTGTQTCNGNGNGYMNERWRAWQHLANAGLIEGTYIGINAQEGYQIGEWQGVDNVNPKSKISRGVWAIGASATYATGLYEFSFINYGGNVLFFGSAMMTEYPILRGNIVRPEEAWGIDGKMDDGLAISGNVWVNYGSGTDTSCTTAAHNNDKTAVYNLTRTAISCSMVFKL